MADQDTQVPAQAATPVNEDSSPAPESSNEEANNLPVTQAEETSEEKEPTVEELKEKYAASSREARLLKEEKELEERKARQLQEDLLSVVTESRETFDKYLDKQGLSPTEKDYYLNIYDTQIDKGQKPTVPNPQATERAIPSMPPVNPVRESWMREMDQERATKIEAQRKASQEFMADPSNKELDQPTLSAIWAQAEYFDTKRGLRPDEALKAARRLVVESESLKDEGYIEGVRDAYVGGVNKGVSGGSGVKGSAFTLSKKGEAFVSTEIRDRGLTGQAAEDFRRAYALREQRSKEE